MSIFKKIYFIGIIIVTLLIIAVYVVEDKDHKYEMHKINYLEDREKERQEKIEELRKNTVECPIKHLDKPRDCYFKSNYRCSWNEDTDRCELK